ncbi:MAG: AsmA family protein [Candidatus Omnitrophota bacterium]
MKKFMMVGGLVLGVVLFLGPVKDCLIQSAAVAGARSVAGVDVGVGYFSLNLWRQSIVIKDLKVYNPQGFPAEKVMVDVPEITVKVDVGALLTGKIHLPYMRVNLKEVRVIRNRVGALNVNSLKFAQQSTGGNKAAEQRPAAGQARAKDIKMRLDRVLLDIGMINIEDYSSGKEKPKLTVLQLNIHDREFRDVASPVELGGLVMFEVLTPVGLDGAFALGERLLGEASGSAIDTALGGLFKSLKK